MVGYPYGVTVDTGADWGRPTASVPKPPALRAGMLVYDSKRHQLLQNLMIPDDIIIITIVFFFFASRFGQTVPGYARGSRARPVAC